MTEMLNLTLKVWRQEGPDTPGAFETYTTKVADDASFLEMLDYVNEDLITKGDEPISFDHDCREGICGTCGLMIDGQAHGPQKGTATCQLHMRKFNSGDEITIEPWRAAGFPIIKDLVVNRAAFDRIIELDLDDVAIDGSLHKAPIWRRRHRTEPHRSRQVRLEVV